MKYLLASSLLVASAAIANAQPADTAVLVADGNSVEVLRGVASVAVSDSLNLKANDKIIVGENESFTLQLDGCSQTFTGPIAVEISDNVFCQAAGAAAGSSASGGAAAGGSAAAGAAAAGATVGGVAVGTAATIAAGVVAAGAVVATVADDDDEPASP